MDPNRTPWNSENEQGRQMPRRTAAANEGRKMEPPNMAPAATQPARRVGYGLPCAKCRTYYGADLPACPYCGCAERVSPTTAPTPATELKNELEILRAEIDEALGQAEGNDGQAAPTPEERENFLRQYRSQLYASHTQINPATAFRCTLERNHLHGFEAAAICKSCYNQAAERVELLEAAMCMDVREAAQIIYDAVWSEPTPADPSRTYQNAAQAVLTELRRRAGMSMLFGSVQPYTH